MPEIRDATPEDLPAILAIYNAVVDTSTAAFTEVPQTEDELLTWFGDQQAAGFPVLVSDDDGEIAGFASYFAFRPWPAYRLTVEHATHVRADRRGTGIGQSLVELLLLRARGAGLHAVVATVDARSQGSIILHERLGFVRGGRLPEVALREGEWHDVELLVRILDR